METASFDGIEIPLVYSSETSRPLQADRRRTAGGKMRQDVIRFKRQWTLITRPMEMEDRDALINRLFDIDFQARDFHLDEFGVGVTVTAYVRLSRELRSLELPERRSLNLIAIEK